MTRELIARAALRAYPPTILALRGEEMLGTLLDSSAGSRTAFAREVASVIRLGVRARATLTASAGSVRVLADGFCRAAIWIMTLQLGTELGNQIRFAHLRPGGHFWGPHWWQLAWLGLTLAIALVGYDRLAGASGLWHLAANLAIDPTRLLTRGLAIPVAMLFVPLVCFTVMLVAPRRRSRDLRRLGWLVVTAPVIFVFGIYQWPSTADLLLLALGLAVLPALATLATDPRSAIACSLLATNLGMEFMAPSVLGRQVRPWALIPTAAAPLVLTFAATRTRRLQRRSVL